MLARVSTAPGVLLLVFIPACFSPTVPDEVGVHDASSTAAGSGSGAETSSSGQDSSTGADGSDTGSTTTSSEASESSSTGTALPGCGDGVEDPGEECDDGNTDDADACSTLCETQFFAGDSAPCSAEQAEVCSFLAGTCHRTVSPAGGGAVCYWEPFSTGSDSCDETPGRWIPSDDSLGEQRGVFLPEPGACMNFVANLNCTAADQTICDAAGAAICFQDKDIDGIGSLGASLCGWTVSQAECEDTPGVWTSSGSTFEQNHPNSVPPGSDGACITQVTNLD